MKVYVTRSVSFPDAELLKSGEGKAKLERRSFSNYICGLIEEDLRLAGLWPPSQSNFRLNEKQATVSSGKMSTAEDVLRDAVDQTASEKRSAAKRPAAPRSSGKVSPAKPENPAKGATSPLASDRRTK